MVKNDLNSFFNFRDYQFMNILKYVKFNQNSINDDNEQKKIKLKFFFLRKDLKFFGKREKKIFKRKIVNENVKN